MPSTIGYIGNAQITTDTWTFVPAALGSPPTSNFFTITCNGKNVTYTAVSSDTVATVVAGLLALVTATTAPVEFGEYAWTSDGVNTLTATAKNAGGPGTFTKSVGNGGGAGAPTFTMTNTIVGTGPNDVANTANYSGGVLPANGDTLILDSRSPSLLWNLNTLSAVVLALLDAKASFSGQVGLPPVNGNGYPEYRPTSLAIGPGTLRVGAGIGSGSSRIRIAMANNNTTIQLFATAGSADQGIGALQLTGSGTNTLEITNGSIDFAPYGGDAAAINSIKQSGGSIHCPTWVVPVTITQSGGTGVYDGGFSTSLTMTGGQVTVAGSGSPTTLSLQNATFIENRNGGTTTNVTVNVGAVIDKSQDINPVTYTNCTLNGGTVKDPANAITVTNGYQKGAATQQILAQ